MLYALNAQTGSYEFGKFV